MFETRGSMNAFVVLQSSSSLYFEFRTIRIDCYSVNARSVMYNRQRKPDNGVKINE